MVGDKNDVITETNINKHQGFLWKTTINVEKAIPATQSSYIASRQLQALPTEILMKLLLASVSFCNS